VEEGEYVCEYEYEEDGVERGGLPPFPLPSHPENPYPLAGFELSLYSLVFLSS